MAGFSLLFVEPGILLAPLPPLCAARSCPTFSKTGQRPRARRWMQGQSPIDGIPSDFHHCRSIPAHWTWSLNQGPALLSVLLLYRKKSGWSAKPQGPGAHVASGSHWVTTCMVLCSDEPDDRNRNQGLTQCEGTKIDVKSQNTLIEMTTSGLLWPSRVRRCSVSKFFFSSVEMPGGPGPPNNVVWVVQWKFQEH